MPPRWTAAAAAAAALVAVAVAALSPAPVAGAPSGSFDSQIAVEAAVPARVDFYSPHVFDFAFYARHNNLTETVRSSRDARKHWAATGLKAGLRASPKFWSRAYLQHNVDVRDLFGEDNYPMAVLHYLRHGINETWRETGGPSRAPIFDGRVFQWRYYAQKNRHLALETEKEAREHWRAHGLDEGLVASPDISLKEYLRENADLRLRVGPTNYAAALAYFVERGHKETWRPNGGETCRFWGTWCRVPALHELVLAAPSPPAYNSTGLAYDANFQAPIPQSAGYDVTINNVDCADLKNRAEPRPSHSRVETVYHLHFRGMAGYERPCNVFVRHYVDLQTRTQDSSPEELSLRHWDFDERAPAPALRQPANLTYTLYSGRSWFKRSRQQPGERDTVTPHVARGAINYTVSSFVMVDPTVDTGAAQRAADKAALPSRTLWSVQHHYRPAPGAPAGVGQPWSDNLDSLAFEIDEEAARAAKARANTFFQPAHTPYRGTPLSKGYYVSSGVIPYYEKRKAEADRLQRQKTEADLLREGLAGV